MDAIGAEQIAKVKSRGLIESANSDKEAYVKEQDCLKTAGELQYGIDTTVADFQRDYEKRVAEFNQIVFTKQVSLIIANNFVQKINSFHVSLQASQDHYVT